MVSRTEDFQGAFEALPLVAILRGVKPEEVLNIADALVAAGFRMIEVPLNSPQAFLSIERLLQHCPKEVLLGAGTVLSVAQAQRLAATGASLMVTPNVDSAVIEVARRSGLCPMIGCLTPTEALAATAQGVQVLKVFPAGRLPPAYARDIKAVLPARSRLLAVGGIDAEDMPTYARGGYDGFGLGSSLYAPGRSARAVAERAQRFVDIWRGICAENPPCSS